MQPRPSTPLGEVSAALSFRFVRRAENSHRRDRRKLHQKVEDHDGVLRAVPTGAGRGPIDIAQKFDPFTEHWSPKIIAESNGWQVKLVKASNEFVWHQHEIDEVFLVFAGQVTIQLRGAHDVTLGPGQLFVVRRRTENRPYAPKGCQLMLLEPAGVVNTGSAPGERTAVDEWI